MMTGRILAASAAFALAVACAAPPADRPQPEAYDLLITGGTVLDGTGAEGFRADVAVRDDRIVRISRDPLPHEGAARVIDAAGMHVVPGFIDVHAHLDPILRLPDSESHVRQGVTTALGGPDGRSPWPIAEQLDTLEALGIGMNVAYTVGHNTIRQAVMGLDDRLATPAELEEMRGMMARAMEEGAFGISTGLKYLPGAFADLDEVVALSRVVADAGGFYTSHLREEGLGLIEAVEETIEIGRQAGLPVVISHHKVVGRPMWGKSRETLAMVDSARALGIDVRIDQYPYTATHTGISILVPEWSRAGGDDAFLERLEDPVLYDSIFDGIVFNIRMDRGGDDLRRVQFSGVSWDRTLEGGTLYDWAVREGMDPTPETGAELVIEAMRRGGARAIFHALEEEDVRRIMQHPQTMIASDGRLVRPGDGHPHPRWYGTFPRVLGHYTREEGVLDWPEAVHKMTGLPANLLGLADRGTIREGAFADLVIYDPDRVIDRATFEDPHNYPEGIDWVIVNGVVTVDGGEFRDLRPGRVLRHGRDRAR
jgi:N-acyl-D-amino-acid deacylase